MKRIFYVEMRDYKKNDDEWMPILAFTSKEKAQEYANHWNKVNDGRIYAVQYLDIIS